MGLSRDPRMRDICPVSGKERLSRSEAKSRAKRQRGHSLNLHAYKCRKCGGWHVGNVRKF